MPYARSQGRSITMLHDTVNFALIGCGRVAPRHANSLANLPGARLLAVADVVEKRALHFARDFGVEPYTDYRRLLDRPDVDAVNICTPSGLHACMAIEAMQAGKHVL